jgi:hypothetical protein
MRRMLVAAPLALAALLAPHANAASTALVVPDATGDANFSGLHGQSLPAQASAASFDIKTVTFDTVKTYATKKVRGKKVTVATPTGIRIVLGMAAAPSTTPGSSYGINAEHSGCGAMRLQIYYSQNGPEQYGDLAGCGDNTDPTSTNPEQFRINFSPKIEGNNLVVQVPFKALPKQFKVGSAISDISAYTSTAEFVVAGYQPTDFEPSAGIDIATTDKIWKIA